MVMGVGTRRKNQKNPATGACQTDTLLDFIFIVPLQLFRDPTLSLLLYLMQGAKAKVNDCNRTLYH
jgi:hypothetical protein